MSEIFEIFGNEFEYDFFDADLLDVYEQENQKLLDAIHDESQYNGKSTADGLRYQCKVVDNFFDALLGEGTAEKLFHGKANIRDHMEAFAIVSKAANNTKNEFAELERKYSPNRAERRAAQKQNSTTYQRHAAGKKG